MEIKIRSLDKASEEAIKGLGQVLIDCVEGGASVGFMLPMTPSKAESFWKGALSSMERGERFIFVAEDSSGKILGTVQLILNMPENQPHRGDIAKMLVHRSARCQGIGMKLLTAAEEKARALGRKLLVLDTVTGSDADRMYSRQGWQRSGEIPQYAFFPDGKPCPTTVFYKFL